MQDAADLVALTLPPPYAAVRLDAPARVAAHAVALAPERGAGTLVHAEGPGRLGLAVVLEPDRPLAAARIALPLGMAALAEAVLAHAPPEREVGIGWPDTLLFDGARLGGATLIAPAGTPEDAEPGWLVFAAELIRDALAAPGERPGSTSLAEEGIGPTAALIESFTRHLMLGFDTLAHLGLARATAPYLRRLVGPPDPRRRIEANGDLVETAPGGAPTRRPLAPALAKRAWADPTTGAVRL